MQIVLHPGGFYDTLLTVLGASTVFRLIKTTSVIDADLILVLDSFRYLFRYKRFKTLCQCLKFTTEV